MRNFQAFLSRNPESSLLQHHLCWVPGFGFNRCCKWKKKGSSNLLPNRAMDSDSDFEFDPDKAREALRRLDQQLDSISQKPTDPVPKAKATSPYNTPTDGEIKDVPDAGSFLPYAFFGLLIFTIVYNIVFYKVIKPSIDGPDIELAPARSSLMTQILKAELLPSPEVSVQP